MYGFSCFLIVFLGQSWKFSERPAPTLCASIVTTVDGDDDDGDNGGDGEAGAGGATGDGDGI